MWADCDSSASERRDRFEERIGIGWLGEVLIETGRPGPLEVSWLPHARQRNQLHALAPHLLADQSCELCPIGMRHVQIDEGHLRRRLCCSLKRSRSIEAGVYRVSPA